MSGVPPISSEQARALGISPLDYELQQERATALGDAGRRLVEALDALAAFDDAMADANRGAADGDNGQPPQTSPQNNSERSPENSPENSPADTSKSEYIEARRMDLLWEARERLWFLIVQREACGLRRHGDVFEVFQVPGEVQAGMGPKPKPAS